MTDKRVIKILTLQLSNNAPVATFVALCHSTDALVGIYDGAALCGSGVHLAFLVGDIVDIGRLFQQVHISAWLKI